MLDIWKGYLGATAGDKAVAVAVKGIKGYWGITLKRSKFIETQNAYDYARQDLSEGHYDNIDLDTNGIAQLTELRQAHGEESETSHVVITLLKKGDWASNDYFNL